MKLDKEYWSNRYSNKDTGWDIGYVSTPLKEYFDSLENKDLKILIPGGGNAYEAEYLFNNGFKNVYLLDISEAPLKAFKERVPLFPDAHILCEDFFDHKTKYDLIVEQTFFCALVPTLRKAYVKKMHELLIENGRLTGLLFNIPLNTDKPPFGGSETEYRILFNEYFDLQKMETAKNSIEPRQGNELFFIAFKKSI